MNLPNFFSRAPLAAAFVAALASLGAGAPAAAQVVVATVNDDPITNIDIEQHEKILRVLRRPATPQAALDEIYETRLKLIETSKFRIAPADADVAWALGLTARPMNLQPQQLLASLQHAGVSDDQWRQKWKSEAAWQMYVRALNRTLEVSQSDVRAALAKGGKDRSEQYSVRQVILVLPNGASGALVGSRMAEAQQLRARFNDCSSGLALAGGLRDTAVKEPVSRSASALNDQLRKIIQDTAVGHLTPPQRGPEGVEMLAICSKSNRLDTDAEENMKNDLLTKRLESVSASLYQDVRAKAVIVKR